MKEPFYKLKSEIQKKEKGERRNKSQVGPWGADPAQRRKPARGPLSSNPNRYLTLSLPR
jgi:hypothetical protein